MSQPPTPKRPERNKGSWGSLIFVFVAATGFISFLALAPIGNIGPAIAAGGLIFPTIIALHYFTWGRLMRRMIEDENRLDDPD